MSSALYVKQALFSLHFAGATDEDIEKIRDAIPAAVFLDILMEAAKMSGANIAIGTINLSPARKPV